MSQYELIAFDMDGTLLNSQKEITPRTLAALKKAAAAAFLRPLKPWLREKGHALSRM